MIKILTKDGTETLLNEEFNEAYHSTKAGAYSESLYKFVLPSRIDVMAKEKEEIRILDVGFGLGYNVSVAINIAKRKNPDIKVSILSVEKDTDILNKITFINYPDILKEEYEFILSGHFSSEKIGDSTYRVYKSTDKNVKLKVIFGEGRKILQDFLKERLKFDAVFYDAFSPKVNTEMWTVDIFRVVYGLMTEEAVLSTYSAALSVRRGLIEAGFKIGLVEPLGRKSYSTVASKKAELPPLPEKEKSRIRSSPFSEVFRDKTLNKDREEIWRDWEERVNKRKLSVSKSF